MIFRSDGHLPCAKGGDQGDSAVRAGLLEIADLLIEDISQYEAYPGELVRSPYQFPWNNPGNFTKDQMKCLVAGLYKAGRHDIIRRVLYATIKRCFFMQNIDRDKPGSTKLPYPHKNYKDSNPLATTYPFYAKKQPNAVLGEIESRTFDYADPMFPNDMWFLIKAAKAYELYWFAIIGIPFFILDMVLHSLGTHNEENQTICECYVNGRWALNLYKFINRKWQDISYKYWSERGEIEYHYICIHIVEGAL